MKKLFFRRHKLFFITLALLVICEIILISRYAHSWQRSAILSEGVKATSAALSERTKSLPSEYLQIEQNINSTIKTYRQFISDTWLNVGRRERDSEVLNIPNNNIALFFEISDFVTRSRELCDSLGISYENNYAFGFQEYLNKKEQPLDNEIKLIHSQKEQINLLLRYLLESRTHYLRIDSIERGIEDNSTAYRRGDIFITNENRIHSNELQSNIYRITFESFTATFRKYLNNLREAEVPLIIRGIEIEPYKQTFLNKQAQEYILHGLPTKYVLTIEMLNLPNDLTKRYKRDARYFRRKF